VHESSVNLYDNVYGDFASSRLGRAGTVRVTTFALSVGVRYETRMHTTLPSLTAQRHMV
jgi:hypothetical protein